MLFKSIRSIFFLVSILSLESVMAAGQMNEECSDSRYATLNKEQCITTSVGAGIALASGIMAGLNYRKHSLIIGDPKNWKTLVDDQTNHPASTRIHTKITGVDKGDLIEVKYQLNKVDNDNHHFQVLGEKIDEAWNDFHHNDRLSRTATKSIYIPVNQFYTDSQGHTSTRIVMRYMGEEPDYYARQRYAETAESYRQKANNLTIEKADFVAGKTVAPKYTFEKIFDNDPALKSNLTQFINEQIQKENYVRKINQLPAKINQAAKAKLRWGRAGLIGVAGSFIFIAEEAIAGIIADKLKKGMSVDLELEQLLKLGEE